MRIPVSYSGVTMTSTNMTFQTSTSNAILAEEARNPMPVIHSNSAETTGFGATDLAAAGQRGGGSKTKNKKMTSAGTSLLPVIRAMTESSSSQ